MTDRPEERCCPVCGRNGFGGWRADEESYEDHVAACRRKREIRRTKKQRRRGVRVRGK